MQTAQSYDIDAVLPPTNSSIARDLKLNLSRFLEEGALSRVEALLTLLALATSVQDAALAGFARVQLEQFDVTAEQVQEAAESAAIMGMLNTYYRFRHMIGKPDYANGAGLRMTSLAKPALGKERFEMLALAVSVLNGCENCIRAHEQTLRDAGVGADKVHDLARLAATVKGLSTIST